MVFTNGKRINWIVYLMLFLTFFFIFPNQTNAEYLNLSAQTAVLMDVQSGRILYEKNDNKKMRIASLTKIMTAIVAIENGDLDDIVTTSDNAFGTEGSSIYLKRGEKLSLEDMLYGLMLRSGNDAAVAIAEHIGGSVEGFAYLMNEKATYLGMTNSHYMNPHGLDHKLHYSTANDMAKLTSYALKNPVFKKIVSTKSKTAPLADEPWDRKWANKNKMLNMYDGSDGVKTGYTKLAKRCLSSSATKDGIQLVAITLNAPDDWNDHRKMLDFGFQNFAHTVLIEEGEHVGKVKWDKDDKEFELIASQQFSYSLRESEIAKVVKKLETVDKNKVTINNLFNNDIGKVKFYLNGEYLGSVPVRVKKEKEMFSYNLLETIKGIWRGE